MDNKGFVLQRGERRLTLDRPRVMGVLNVTPDSFSDGGRFYRPESAIDQAAGMVEAGVDILDIGGESTRPGAQAVSVAEEMDRVLPVLETLRGRFDVWISVDTSTPELMRAAAAAGADLLNDVRALTRDGALAAAAELGLPVCLMHMQGEPSTMQQDPRYDDVVNQVAGYLQERRDAAVSAGVNAANILLDPGFGFGKTLAHNLALLRALPHLAEAGHPLLVGLSRKSMLGKITGKAVDQRLGASVAAALLAVQRGAHIIRVHDVPDTVDAIKVWHAVTDAPARAE
ncbi:MAG: dihydropteroate synthase [Natronospirillum sp.]|uniref:dihydropteroate synthase n=1 Tax=Natronospirillum sp. TaxID=2812955 RepID=UPI0025E622E2|nr:dihydropteroate synthase [Natronospirillum sp.]MCH8553416.1 dihydropteroate synthase [Natronospirillum sp.]